MDLIQLIENGDTLDSLVRVGATTAECVRQLGPARQTSRKIKLKQERRNMSPVRWPHLTGWPHSKQFGRKLHANGARRLQAHEQLDRRQKAAKSARRQETPTEEEIGMRPRKVPPDDEGDLSAARNWFFKEASERAVRFFIPFSQNKIKSFFYFNGFN